MRKGGGVILISLAAATGAQGAIWTESPDAGELLGTAQTPTGSGSLDSISGTLIDLGGATDDIDLYRIFINDTDVFSVTVSASLSVDNDAQLWLFDEDGLEVLFNDDGDIDYLPQFNPGDLTGQPTGTYYLGLNLYDTSPDSDPLAGWNRNPDPLQTGPYTLSLTGVTAVPEPTSLLASLGLTSLGMFLKGKKNKK